MSAVVLGQAVTEPVVVDFLGEYCLECHDTETAKADFILDPLHFDFAKPSTVDVWQKVLEKLETGEMPPKKKPRPQLKAKQMVSDWIRAEFAKANVPALIDHKMQSPGFGNHLNHEMLFNGSQKEPASSPPRLWRLSPFIYEQMIEGLGGLRHVRAVHQPFSLDESKGVISDFSDGQFAGNATLQLLLMNCQSIAEYQTVGISKRDHEGIMQRHRSVPDVFRPIVESDDKPSAEQLRAAVHFEYKLILGREATEAEFSQAFGYLDKAQANAGRVRGFQSMLVSIMLKPEAVYRLEVGLGEEDKFGRRRLSENELAFALAFALTDKGPNETRVGGNEGETLFEITKAGGLASPSDIRRVVKQILDENDMSTADYTMFAENHKVRNTRVLRFFRDFFGYHHAPRVFKDENRISIDSGFETKRIVHDADQFVMHIFDEDHDVFRQLLTSNKYFVAYPGSYEKFEKDLNYIRNNVNDANFKNNEKYIARLEAEGKIPIPIEGTSSRTYVKFYNLFHETWGYQTKQPFLLPKNQRAGILTHPAWLIAWSGNFDNDPIRRGKWILEHLLAGTIQDVPVTVNAVIPEDRGRSLRDRLKATKSKECWNCHRKMNPLGLPFESFDDFGRFRKTEMLDETLSIFPERHRDARTVPVQTNGEIADSGDSSLDGPVADAFELVHKLANSTRVRQSFVRHVFRFWMGRNETLADSPTLMAADKAYIENGGSMKAMIASLLSSDSFLYRK
ncbi:DUF1588 domain-containing protein [Verrucomicrobia bacterium]|nr:DUF1588 domain-containing protein [Verrucomicrobiota bacterium]